MGKRILCAVMILLCLTGCAPAPEQSKPTQSTAATQSPPATVSAETEASIPPSEEPAGNLHCGVREDGTFSGGTLFIGDSLTYGFVLEYLMRYELIGDARYMAVNGAPLSRFFDDDKLVGSSAIYAPEFYGLTYSGAVAQMGDEATAVYLMLGTNHSSYATADKYIEVVDYILDHCPNATVHLQLIPYSSNQYVDYETVNEQISAAYSHYQEAGEERVMLVDTFSFIGTAQISDGVHLNSEGQDAWYMALLSHKNQNNLPE